MWFTLRSALNHNNHLNCFDRLIITLRKDVSKISLASTAGIIRNKLHLSNIILTKPPKHVFCLCLLFFIFLLFLLLRPQILQVRRLLPGHPIPPLQGWGVVHHRHGWSGLDRGLHRLCHSLRQHGSQNNQQGDHYFFEFGRVPDRPRIAKIHPGLNQPIHVFRPSHEIRLQPTSAQHQPNQPALRGDPLHRIL